MELYKQLLIILAVCCNVLLHISECDAWVITSSIKLAGKTLQARESKADILGVVIL